MLPSYYHPRAVHVFCACRAASPVKVDVIHVVIFVTRPDVRHLDVASSFEVPRAGARRTPQLGLRQAATDGRGALDPLAVLPVRSPVVAMLGVVQGLLGAPQEPPLRQLEELPFPLGTQAGVSLPPCPCASEGTATFEALSMALEAALHLPSERLFACEPSASLLGRAGQKHARLGPRARSRGSVRLTARGLTDHRQKAPWSY